MKTCSETSSVKRKSDDAPWFCELCVTDGLSFASRKRACEPYWSHSTYIGTGKRSVRRTAASSFGAASSSLKFWCSGSSW